MDAESYLNAAQAKLNQPLGGKELAFPYGGLSDTVEASRLGSPFTVASVNVMLRDPYNGERCGGTRPGLREVTGVITENGGRFLWPNGDKILWPDGNAISFSDFGTKVIMPDGSAMLNPHETFNVKASKGSVPAQCSAMAMYRARMVVSNGTLWFASRTGALDDFDYGGDFEDVSRAVSGNVALAGRKGEAITALASVQDAALVIATRRSLWRSNGEITSALVPVSESIGIISRDAWCWDDMRFWFIGPEGLYAMVIGEAPINMTPHLAATATGWKSATLLFDRERNGIHIFGVKQDDSRYDAYYDIANKAWWKMEYPAAKRPNGGGMAILDGRNTALFYCADSKFRRWHDAQTTDDGTAIASALALGPVVHTTGNTENAFLGEMDVETDDANTAASGVSVSLATGRTSNETADGAKRLVAWAAGGAGTPSADEKARYGVGPGWNRVKRPRLRCNGVSAVVWSAAGRWAISKVTAVHRGCGRIRR